MPRGATSWSAAAETKKHDEDVARRRELPNQSLPVAGRTSEVELVETPCKETAHDVTAASSETAAAGEACVDDGRVVEDDARGVPNPWELRGNQNIGRSTLIDNLTHCLISTQAEERRGQHGGDVDRDRRRARGRLGAGRVARVALAPRY